MPKSYKRRNISSQITTLVSAQQKRNSWEKHACSKYKTSLRIASSSIQSVRMIRCLNHFIEERSRNGENTTNLRKQVEAIHTRLLTAIGTQDAKQVKSSEMDIARVAHKHCPEYFELENDRKTLLAEHIRLKRYKPPTWSSKPSSRFISLTRGDLHAVNPVSDDDVRSCTSSCAWSIALIGMMVAIMFLIIDFWYAQNNPSVSTTIVENNTLQLPVIFACLSVPNIPTFENLSREQFAGEPLWGLSTYSNDQKNQFLKYPKTKDALTTPSLLGNEAVCSSSLQHLSLRGTLLGLTPWGNASRRCFSCLKIGVKQPIVLSASPEKHRPAGPIKLGFSFSRYLSFCFNGLADGFNIILMNNLRETIKRSSQQLLEKRIVQMVSNKNGTRDLEVAFDIGFNPYVKKRKSRVLRQRLEAELLCNLYFFSGHFFPIEPGTAVQYSFDINRELNAWQPVGDLSNVFRIPTSYMEVYNRTTILEGIRNDNYGNRIVFSLPGIYIYSMGDNSDGQPSFRNKLDWIVGRETCLIRFTKHIENEVVTYGYSIQRTGIGTSITNDMFSRVQLSLDFETFSTEVVTKRPTTSFVEFCTDLFEYAGLFTGVCVYSMFVGPARMYLKRFKKQSD